MTLAVLCHTGTDVPIDETVWLPLQRSMRSHSRDSGVQAAAGVLLKVLACQENYKLADLAAKFSGELLETVRNAKAVTDTALTVRDRAAGQLPQLCGDAEVGLRPATAFRAAPHAD